MEQNQIQEIPPEWRDLIVYEEMEVPPESEDLLQSLYDDEGEIVEINNKCCDAAADLDLDVDLEMDDDNKAGNEDDIENFATIFDRDGEYIWPIFLIEVNKFPPLLESLEGYHRKALCKTFQARLAKKNLVFNHKGAMDFLFKRLYDSKCETSDGEQPEEGEEEEEVEIDMKPSKINFPWAIFMQNKKYYYCKTCKKQNLYHGATVLKTHQASKMHQRKTRETQSKSPTMPSPSCSLHKFLKETEYFVSNLNQDKIKKFKDEVHKLCLELQQL
ncbi:uncharacterized protein LOC142228517 [Haematobia irritans]|uniref:uncharacterized protein LOC142228517 n=1 Tax=Haematobia irritans TaxID=7368 RepID=UPI003F5073BD